MRAVLQRVSRARVLVGDEVIGAIGPGLLVLLGVHRLDREAHADLLARKTAELRIFADEAGKMNRSVVEAGGGVLVVSQFTLLADLRKGRRPAFVDAAPPEQAIPLVARYVDQLRARGLTVAEGRFGAMMQVELVNDGPVTITFDTDLWPTP